MGFGWVSRIYRVRVTVIYAVSLLAVSLALARLGPDAQDRVIRHASTNLHNLNHGHLGTLIGSAFVIDGGPVYLWLPGLVCLLGLGEVLWRSGRSMVALVVGHVGATLLVAVGLTAAVELAWLPSTVARATDVGMSYSAIGVLGALTPTVHERWRPSWIGWWLAVGATVVVLDRDFTAVGHLVALSLGMVVAMRFGRPRRWTLARLAVLSVAVGFGFLILVSPTSSIGGAVVAGAMAALFCAAFTLRAAGRAGRRRVVVSVSSAERMTHAVSTVQGSSTGPTLIEFMCPTPWVDSLMCSMN